MKRMVLWAMFLMLSLVAMSVSADEKGGAKTDGEKAAQKKAAKLNKCWERMEAYKSKDGGFYVSGDLPVCKVFEEVLNTTCESPDKLQCNWTLPEGEKKFQKLKWETVDWREYWDIIGQLSVSRIFPTGTREERWELMKDSVREDFEKGKSSLSITTVDINHDGTQEQVARIDSFSIPCNKKIGETFGIVDINNKEVIPFQGLFFNININSSPEIMNYNGRAFMFSLYSEDMYRHNVMIHEGLPHGERYGNQNVCQIRYIKGGK